MANPKFKVLSIDGGGIRGIIPCIILRYIEEKHDSRYGYLIINNFPEDCLPYRIEEKE